MRAGSEGMRPGGSRPRGASDPGADGAIARIREIRAERGDSLLILGHHYQADDVITLADLQGDSFLLSYEASRSTARDIVFLGVHFMAETAEILSGPGQTVYLPDPGAGCAMANMAHIDAVERCWAGLSRRWDGPVIPVAYVNSSADIKAFCGRNGGVTCTSSSAVDAFTWALDRGRRVLFLPDRCLGANTAARFDMDESAIAVYDRENDRFTGSTDPRVILWDGFCPVHQDFTARHIEEYRRHHPGARVIVHPECPPATVRAADLDGSTELIRRVIGESPPGSSWAVGTDPSLVNRLKGKASGRSVVLLGDAARPCPDMMKIGVKDVLALLERIASGNAGELAVTVDPQVSREARVALERMLALK